MKVLKIALAWPALICLGIVWAVLIILAILPGALSVCVRSLHERLTRSVLEMPRVERGKL